MHITNIFHVANLSPIIGQDFIIYLYLFLRSVIYFAILRYFHFYHSK